MRVTGHTAQPAGCELVSKPWDFNLFFFSTLVNTIWVAVIYSTAASTTTQQSPPFFSLSLSLETMELCLEPRTLVRRGSPSISSPLVQCTFKFLLVHSDTRTGRESSFFARLMAWAMSHSGWELTLGSGMMDTLRTGAPQFENTREGYS